MYLKMVSLQTVVTAQIRLKSAIGLIKSPRQTRNCCQGLFLLLNPVVLNPYRVIANLSRFLVALALVVVSHKSVLNSWTTRRAQLSGTSRALVWTRAAGKQGEDANVFEQYARMISYACSSRNVKQDVCDEEMVAAVICAAGLGTTRGTCLDGGRSPRTTTRAL